MDQTPSHTRPHRQRGAAKRPRRSPPRSIGAATLRGARFGAIVAGSLVFLVLGLPLLLGGMTRVVQSGILWTFAFYLIGLPVVGCLLASVVGAAVMGLAAFLDKPAPEASLGEVPLDAPVLDVPALDAPVEPEPRVSPVERRAVATTRPIPTALRRGAGLGVVVGGLLTMTCISLPALFLHLLSVRSYLYGGYGLNGGLALLTGLAVVAIAALGGAVVGGGLIGLAAMLSGPSAQQETDSCPLDPTPDDPLAEQLPKAPRDRQAILNRLVRHDSPPADEQDGGG